jgi:hypothetical protein
MSRNWPVVAVLGLLTTCGSPGHLAQSGPGPTTESGPADTLLLSTASRIVGSASRLAAIWPGYWPRGQAFIIAKPGCVLLVSETAPDSGFQRLPNHSLPRVLRGRAFVHSGSLRGLFASSVPGGLNIQYAVAGTTVTAVAVKDSVRTTAEFLLHEAFHAFQDSHFARKPEAGPEQASHESPPRPEFDARAEAERRILAEALLADLPTTRELLRSYTAVRSQRLNSLRERERAEELQMERIEGTAQLVGVQGSLAVIGAPKQVALRLVRDLLTAELTESDPAWRTRLRVYGTGAALGLLLDRLHMPWQSALQRGETFEDVLAAAFPISADARGPIAETALARFGNRPRVGLHSDISTPSQSEDGHRDCKL